MPNFVTICTIRNENKQDDDTVIYVYYYSNQIYDCKLDAGNFHFALAASHLAFSPLGIA